MRWNVAVAGLAGAWGLIAVIVAAVDLDATVLVFFRLSLAAVTLAVAAALWRRRPSALPRDHVAAVVALGLVLAVHWTLYFQTIKLASVAVAVITVYTAPVFIAVAAPLVLPERRSVVGVVALVPAVAGIVLIALAGDGGGRVGALALACGVGAGATYAALVILGKRIRLTLNALAATLWSDVVAALALAPLLFAAGRVLPSGGRETAAVLLLGIVFTGISGVCYLWLLGHVTAQAAGILAFVEPVSAALLAWLFLDEAIGWATLVGGALVLGAGAAVVLREPAGAAAVEALPVAATRDAAAPGAIGSRQ